VLYSIKDCFTFVAILPPVQNHHFIHNFMCLLRVSIASTISIAATFAILFSPVSRAFRPLARYGSWGARHLSIYANPAEEDILKWETMYSAGDEADNYISQKNFSPNQIRVVTFDLDNTLWKTGPTISAANDELAKFLDTMSIVQPQRVEVIMGQLWERSKAKYAPIGGEDAKAPVLLTQLRTDALEFVLLQHNEYSAEEAKDLAEQSFTVWTNARHEAINLHLVDSVVETLQKIRRIESSTGQPVLIGAITDGNSDPRNIPQLAAYFDFCVNAESVGISKPAREVYLTAMREAATHTCVQDIFDLHQPNLTDEKMEDIIGSWWVHIGDDFVKDIVAAKELGMRSVWCRELIVKPIEELKADEPPKLSVDEFVKKISGMKEIKMNIGGGDYLATSLQDEFADSIIDTFASLHQVLDNWHQSAAQKAVMSAATEEMVEPITNTATRPPPARRLHEGNTKAEESRFCMACGTKVPVSARFCFSCGEKMPNT